MKCRVFSSLILSLSCLSVAQAEDRAFLFLQQEKPGHIIYVSAVARSGDAVLSVVGMGHETVEKRFPIPIKKFNEYWETINSADLQKYKYFPKDDESVTDLDFYTIRMESGDSEVLLKLPNMELNEAANAFLKNIQGYIKK